MAVTFLTNEDKNELVKSIDDAKNNPNISDDKIKSAVDLYMEDNPPETGGVSSWNDLTDKPFYDESLSLTYDGNYEDKTYTTDDIDYWIKVSEDIVESNKLIGATLTVVREGVESTITLENSHFSQYVGYILIEDSNGSYVYIVTNDSVEWGGAVLTKGIWFEQVDLYYVKSLYYNGLKKLDEKFLPDNVSTKEDINKLSEEIVNKQSAMYIDVTKPPKEYTGTPISTDSENNSGAFYEIIMWALKEYVTPVLYFPTGEYNFTTNTHINPVFEERIAKSLRITGGYDATINWNVGQSEARVGWIEFFYQNTVETYNTFSAEIDHLRFVKTVELEDNVHSNFQWIWVDGSQLADVWMDIINIHHCRFENQCGGAILIGYARQLFVEDNYFHNCYEATSNDDSGFIIHVGQSCKNAVVRKNYMYVDDTKQLCGAGIVSEYQTGCTEIVDNYVYGYDRGIHIELTQRDGTQIVRSNYCENCVDGIVVWNALSDCIIDGNKIWTTDEWDYTDRLTYSENGFSGIRFPTYARNKSVVIKHNTVRLKTGAPISNTAGGNYSGIYYFPKNWTIAYNELYSTEPKNNSVGRVFYCPLYSEIHNNDWTLDIFNFYGTYKTNVHHNTFHANKIYSQSGLDGTKIKYIAPNGDVLAESLHEYMTNYDTNLRGTRWLEKYACRFHDNVVKGIADDSYCLCIFNTSTGLILYNNELHHSGSTFHFTSMHTSYPDKVYGIAYNNVAYLYDGATLSNALIQGVRFDNKAYSVADDGTITLVYDDLTVGNSPCMYKSLMSPKESKNNIAFMMPVFPYNNNIFNKGNYLVGDICYNYKWTPNSGLIHHQVCITAGVGASDDETVTVAEWKGVYEDGTYAES